MNRLLFYIGFALLFVACSDDVPSEQTVEASAAMEHDTVADGWTSLAEHGLAMEIKFPQAMLEAGQPEVKYNNAFGRVEITVGSDYVLHIQRNQMPLDQVKRELHQQGVLEYVFFESNDNTLLYQTKLPTGEIVGHHTIRCMEMGDKRYHAASDPQKDYSEFEARNLLKAINSLRAL